MVEASIEIKTQLGITTGDLIAERVNQTDVVDDWKEYIFED
jgi:hypothetical protein